VEYGREYQVIRVSDWNYNLSFKLCPHAYQKGNEKFEKVVKGVSQEEYTVELPFKHHAKIHNGVETGQEAPQQHEVWVNVTVWDVESIRVRGKIVKVRWYAVLKTGEKYSPCTPKKSVVNDLSE